jgi:hypothetical protein
MASKQQELSRLHTDLGYKPLTRAWAKIEILFGLAAGGAGLLLGNWALVRAGDMEWGFIYSALGLFVLGGYLALAGHRSHLYQSNNELIAYLMSEIQRLQQKVESQ